MNTTYYKRPLALRRLFDRQYLETCSLGMSISQHIELIIFTRFGEHRYDPGFGCEVWELDFELITSRALWEDKMQQSLHRALAEREQRIYDVAVTIEVTDVEKVYPLRLVTEIKKRVSVGIRARVTATGERYSFQTSLFLSPLSSE
jgi:phage baseplate assembly protein W